jgi:hypothetical protein
MEIIGFGRLIGRLFGIIGHRSILSAISAIGSSLMESIEHIRHKKSFQLDFLHENCQKNQTEANFFLEVARGIEIP